MTEAFFDGHPSSLAVFRAVQDVVTGLGPVTMRTSKSQVAFARRRGFAYLWLPGRWLRKPAAETVLSIALARHDQSARWKEVAHPSGRVWMHHLEVQQASEIDDAVADWLREAYEGAT